MKYLVRGDDYVGVGTRHDADKNLERDAGPAAEW